MSPLPSLSDVLLHTQTDERLARLAGSGDQRAFAMLVHRHRIALLRLAGAVVGAQRSEDVVQQVLLRAWVSLTAGTEVRNVQAWLYRIVRNAAYSEHSRGSEAADPIQDELVDPGSSTVAEQRLLVRELVENIAGLPEHQRVALVETELEGRSRQQIAAEMGVSEGAVRQLVHRARTAVRLAMTAIIPYPVVAWASRHSGGSRFGAGLLRFGDTDIAGRSAGFAEPAASGAAGAAIAVKSGVALLAAGAIGGLGWHALISHGRHHAVRTRPAAAAVTRRGGLADSAGVAAQTNLSSFAAAARLPVIRPVAGAPAAGRAGFQAAGRGSRGGAPQSVDRSSGSERQLGSRSEPSDRSSTGSQGGTSDGMSSSSDGSRSGGEVSSQPSGDSLSRQADGEASSSTAPISGSGSTTGSDGGSREVSTTSSTTPLPSGGDN